MLTDVEDRVSEFFGTDLCGDSIDVVPEDTTWSALASAFFSRRTLRLLRSESLATPPGRTFVLLAGDSPRSNLELLAELQREGAPLPENLVCAAVEGSGFVGRHDRSWRSGAGNLHAVVRLTPELPLEQVGCAFSILPAVACLEVLSARTGVAAPAGIKWINDLVCGPRKVAGFLARQSYQAPLVTEVLLGVGVNLGGDPAPPPDPFVPATGSLARLFPGADWSPGGYLVELLGRLRHWTSRLAVEGTRPLLERYREASCILGRAVRVYEDGPGLEGTGLDARTLLARGVVEAIGDELELVLSGRREPITRGRLAFEEDCGSP